LKVYFALMLSTKKAAEKTAAMQKNAHHVLFLMLAKLADGFGLKELTLPKAFFGFTPIYWFSRSLFRDSAYAAN